MVFNKSEIKKILDDIINKKHKLIISLIYSAGLKVSEVVKIKVQDLDFENNTLFIRQSKGRKDRITIFAKKLGIELKEHIESESIQGVLFKNNQNKPLTTRTIQKIFSQVLERAKINKKASCYSL